MKKLSLIGVVILIFIQSCVIRSVHPFYLFDDLITDNALYGKWHVSSKKYDSEPNNTSTWEFIPLKENTELYELKMSNQGKKLCSFVVGMFEKNDDVYLDFYPYELSMIEEEQDGSPFLFLYHLQPSHSLAKIEFDNNNQAVIKWFNERHLKSLIQQNKIRIKHEKIKDFEDNAEYMLTATTEELQKFIEKYGKDEKAFDEKDISMMYLTRNAK